MFMFNFNPFYAKRVDEGNTNLIKTITFTKFMVKIKFPLLWYIQFCNFVQCVCAFNFMNVRFILKVISFFSA